MKGLMNTLRRASPPECLCDDQYLTEPLLLVACEAHGRAHTPSERGPVLHGDRRLVARDRGRQQAPDHQCRAREARARCRRHVWQRHGADAARGSAAGACTVQLVQGPAQPAPGWRAERRDGGSRRRVAPRALPSGSLQVDARRKARRCACRIRRRGAGLAAAQVGDIREQGWRPRASREGRGPGRGRVALGRRHATFEPSAAVTEGRGPVRRTGAQPRREAQGRKVCGRPARTRAPQRGIPARSGRAPWRGAIWRARRPR